MSRIPPNDEDSEKAIIGACLMSREARDQSLNLVSTSDFYSVRLGKVFSAVSNLSAMRATYCFTHIFGALVF